MIKRPFAAQGFQVSALGLGAGQIGDATLSEDQVGTLINAALDMGINLVDTARGYGLSEERIGRHLAHRRGDYILSTKVGYGIPGHADWTYDGILAGVDEALHLMRTDHIDIVHLHGPSLETLQRGDGDVIVALEQARDQGKLRVIAFSGENEELDWAVNSGRFGSVECSVNLCDQRSLHGTVQQAAGRGVGVIAKRSVANAPWRFSSRPHGHYCEEYWGRWQTMALDAGGLDWQELALRFSAFAPGVSCAIVGTTSLEHLRHNIQQVDKGPLPPELVARIIDAFREHGRDWSGQA